MADSGSNNLGFHPDIKQMLKEAQHRWLRPAEICEILRDYQKFHISSEPPHKPVSGSVFLFDRKVLRYFRKDGHNWRKKKDGKTIKEAHEKLKVGSIDMLHCYYAHGEDNENFQRRSYWMLEQDLMHIVFVHYLEVKGNKMNMSYARNNESSVSNSEEDSSSSSFRGNYDKIVSANATSSSPISTPTSAYESAESDDILQGSSRLDSFPESPLVDGSHITPSSSYDSFTCPGNQNVAAMNYASLGHRYENSDGGSAICGAQTKLELASWEDVFGHCTADEIDYKQGSGCSLPVHSNWQVDPYENSHSDIGNLMDPRFENDMASVGTENYSSLLKKPLISGLQMEESLKKVDSFSRWVAKELGEADELHMESSNVISWGIMGSEDYSSMPAQIQEDLDALSPSLSQDQLFSIIDFSPNWAYTKLETEVLIAGAFLKSEQELANCRWSVMFGEFEVPAEVLEDGLLCCHAPQHKPGLVPFYITCSNRLACSEVREFEYRIGPNQKIGAEDISEGTSEIQFRQRFEKLMSLSLVCNTNISEIDTEKQNLVNKIFSLMERENHQEEKATSKNYMSLSAEQVLEKQLKEKFYSWLLHEVTEDGKGPNVVDEGGQGALHLAAALGYNWALLPIIVSGVSIDFRDVNGWTALHWAALCGREDTVASLISLGAASGALTDPCAEYPLGRTPADLASAGGHKGISGFLAETSLTTHLSSLTVNDPQDYGASEVSEVKAIETVSERTAIPTTEQDVPDVLSLKDSLAAVCNATQAAARIHQIFRVQSFQMKHFNEQSFDELVTPEEHAISLVAAKTSRLGRNDGINNDAALHIQKKFRGWKKRQEFLLIRQKIVKIQAHVRGHQVRKKYKPIVWSVGILEKVILRWRRKGTGLRGFQRDGILKGPNAQGAQQQEDDYDFLKEGRKQTEERSQKALSRVKSMIQYPEARAQYRRLLAAAEGFRETTDAIETNPEDTSYPEEELIDFETLLDDDTFMSLTFQ
ncbi:calmodulin-binding transcription activator 2-like isoform X2 [Olea europaea subsp. europaea]|uniref:Calmodulin-binding transcription activator 2-like isoform X2 n=1 Tax=Olea europaea subsp. europaea TaxID=158383 RepID=A0A8S0QS32_OLEEU|nr:calmodulin-binding transcription activator 2-like isoform X2 [Olea europaea subsp. europaea]